MSYQRHGLVLVTGAGTGVGGSVARVLAGSGFSVLANFRTATPRALRLDGLPGVTLLQGDLLDASTLASVPSSVRAVVHCAATLESSNVSDLMDGNVVATRDLLRHVEMGLCQTWIQLSTVSVHGEVTGGKFSRQTGFNNPSCYGLTKRLAEQFLEQAVGLDSVHCFRLPSVLAPRARSHWLARVAASAQRGEPITVTNPASLFNNTIHVDDLCSYLIRIRDQGKSGSYAYPLASSAPVPSIEIVREVTARIWSDSVVISGADSDNSFVINDSYARESHGYESRSSMRAVADFVSQINAASLSGGSLEGLGVDQSGK